MAGRSGDEEWYLRDLLAFMLGIGAGEIGDLARTYLDQGGEKEVGTLFRYLSAQGRRYRVLWILFSFTDQISLAAVSLFGPEERLLWQDVSALPYGASSATLTSWRRILPLVGGIVTSSQPKVSESDLWVAGQMTRHLRLVWSNHAHDMLVAVEGRREAGVPSFQGGRDFLRDLPFDLERALRESTGKNLPGQALFLEEVALPDLRDAAGQILSLQRSLDSFVEETVGLESPAKEDVPEHELPARQGLKDFSLHIDPVLGVPLSELRPGTPVLLDGEGTSPVVGKAYMIRLLKSGQIEVHGALAEEEGTFFRSVAPGDIKVAVSREGPLPSLVQPSPVVVGVLVLVVLLLLLLLR